MNIFMIYGSNRNIERNNSSYYINSGRNYYENLVKIPEYSRKTRNNSSYYINSGGNYYRNSVSENFKRTLRDNIELLREKKIEKIKSLEIDLNEYIEKNYNLFDNILSNIFETDLTKLKNIFPRYIVDSDISKIDLMEKHVEIINILRPKLSLSTHIFLVNQMISRANTFKTSNMEIYKNINDLILEICLKNPKQEELRNIELKFESITKNSKTSNSSFITPTPGYGTSNLSFVTPTPDYGTSVLNIKNYNLSSETAKEKIQFRIRSKIQSILDFCQKNKNDATVAIKEELSLLKLDNKSPEELQNEEKYLNNIKDNLEDNLEDNLRFN